MQMKSIFNGLWILFIGFFLTNSQAQERTSPSDQPDELGKVSWYRDYETAKKLATEQQKAILVFFQEVPGCATSTGYGTTVLQHPLLVEAIEEEFIPLVIFNNQDGKDKEVLTLFKEPSWNNPVVRIVDPEGKDLVKRVAGDYTVRGLYTAMKNALNASNKALPEYFKLAIEELEAAGSSSIKEKHFKMYCFWSGETHLGKARGVLKTEPGFMGGYEVVKVVYDENIISEKELNAHAQSARFEGIAKDKSYRIATKDNKYNLQHTNYKYLPLTALQQTKINSALGNRRAAEKYLSPKQLVWLQQLNSGATKGKALSQENFKLAWEMKLGR